VTAPSNQYAAENRERKANAVVEYMLNRLINIVREQSDKEWTACLFNAGVNSEKPPSPESKALILAKLERLGRLHRAI
jgi:hypothetical protein